MHVWNHNTIGFHWLDLWIVLLLASLTKYVYVYEAGQKLKILFQWYNLSITPYWLSEDIDYLMYTEPYMYMNIYLCEDVWKPNVESNIIVLRISVGLTITLFFWIICGIQKQDQLWLHIIVTWNIIDLLKKY